VFEPTWWTLHILKRVGLASDFVLPSKLDKTIRAQAAAAASD